MTGLPRRAFLGARLPPDAFGEAGARVTGVAPGSMAEAAGLAAGDTLIAIAGVATRSLAELGVALRRAGAGDEVEIVSSRAGARRAAVQHAPREDGAVYEHLTRDDGVRLRTIVTRHTARRPAILVVQGITTESIDFAGDPDAPLGRLVRAWTDAGFVTLRLERRGVGDSEGAHCAGGDFATELADHRAALEALLADPLVDPARVAIFGHSVGGMMAPLLGPDRPIVVYGTSCAKWRDCVIASQRRQLELRGVAEDEIARHVTELRARLTASPPSGRTAAYHAQLDAIDLAAAWSRVTRPALVLRGGFDWVVGADEQARIAAIVPGARVVDLAGLDHLLGWHATLADSINAYGRGRWDERLAAETIAWMSEQARPAPE